MELNLLESPPNLGKKKCSLLTRGSARNQAAKFDCGAHIGREPSSAPPSSGWGVGSQKLTQQRLEMAHLQTMESKGLGAAALQGNLLAPPWKKLLPMTARRGQSSRTPAASSIATAADPFVSTCHVLASQPLMASGCSSRFPGKPREGGLTCWPPSLSFPQFRRPTSGPDAPRLPCKAALSAPLPKDRCHVRLEWPGGRDLRAKGRSLGLNSEG